MTTRATRTARRSIPGETPAACNSIEQVFSVLGRAWAGAVLYAMLDGNQRFSEIARAVPGVTDSVLTTRLRELCDFGAVERTVEMGPPVAVRYRLTPAGRGVAPVLKAARTYAANYPELFDGH